MQFLIVACCFSRFISIRFGIDQKCINLSVFAGLKALVGDLNYLQQLASSDEECYSLSSAWFPK
jgi:hypothetical protein